MTFITERFRHRKKATHNVATKTDRELHGLTCKVKERSGE